LLDYEFWQSDYGGAPVNSFEKVDSGWVAYQSLCADMITARNNPANHLKYAATWIGRILEPEEKDWDVDGDGTIGINLDPDDTYQAIMDKIDSYGMDRIVLAFFLTDKTYLSPSHFSQQPIAFLQRDGVGVNTINETDWFMRLWYFSNNSINTNIVGNFHAGYGNTTTSANPKLVNYLLGQGYYTTPSYLADAEHIFLDQFNDPAIFTNYLNTGPTWGSINLFQGFEWFRYEIGPLEFASIATRPNDAIHPFYNTCHLPNRLSYTMPVSFTNGNTHNAEVQLSIAPQPLQKFGNVYVSNVAASQNISLQFIDQLGQDITHYFMIVDKADTDSDAIVYFEMITQLSGMVLCKVYVDGKCVGNIKCVTIK
jgi:hypothetical protein